MKETRGDAVTRAQELLAAATPGPWWLLNEYTEPWEEGDEWHVYGRVGNRIPRVVDNSEDQLTWSDAELIAAAPTLLAELANEVERLTPVCSGCRYEPEAECPVHGYSRAELWAEVERLTSENGDLSDYACMCVGGEWDLTCPVHTDGEDVASASERISALAEEVDRLRAALHLRDTTPKPPENAAWHWSLISNSDYTKVCAENALLRALTTVDDAMGEWASLALHHITCDTAYHECVLDQSVECRAVASAALEAALGVES